MVTVMVNDGKTCWSMRKNILYGLFDLGRLIINDQKKLQAFHNEIARLCNQAYENVKEHKERAPSLEEKRLVYTYFIDSFNHTSGYQISDISDTPIRYREDLQANLQELMEFMYGPEQHPTTTGFLRRTNELIHTQFDLHYKEE